MNSGGVLAAVVQIIVNVLHKLGRPSDNENKKWGYCWDCTHNEREKFSGTDRPRVFNFVTIRSGMTKVLVAH